MKEFYLTAVAALCASGFVCAHAQNPQSDTTIVHLRDVEVMANRADHRTPVAFSNLTAAEIERVNDGRDIPFLLESMPSVVTTGDAGGGIGYSGLRVRGTDLAHQHHGQRCAHQRFREPQRLLGEHARLGIVRARHTASARRRHIDQRRGRVRSVCQHDYRRPFVRARSGIVGLLRQLQLQQADAETPLGTATGPLEHGYAS